MLKKYSLIKGVPSAISGGQVFGYVQIKKELDNLKLIIVLNNDSFGVAYIVVASKVMPVELKSSITNFTLPSVCQLEQVGVIVPYLGLYACGSLQQLINAYSVLAEYLIMPKQQDIQTKAQALVSSNNKPSVAERQQTIAGNNANTTLQNFCEQNCKHIIALEKIFNKPVLETNFFDSIKPKLAKLFALGQPQDDLCNRYAGSRWVSLRARGGHKVIGIVYYLGYPFAIGLGGKNSNNGYNLHFFSAADGNTLNMPI